MLNAFILLLRIETTWKQQCNSMQSFHQLKLSKTYVIGTVVQFDAKKMTRTQKVIGRRPRTPI